MVKISLVNLTKVFGKAPREVIAVDNLNLEIKDGEFMVLLGPSGCGKTTTLRLIAGLETPTKGKIYFDDEDVTGLPPKDRDVAMVFQSYAVYPHMKVFDNIAFPLRIRKLPKSEIKDRVKRVVEYLGIGDLLDRMPSQLSGGQLQRVALARALVREPRVFLFDEPLSNLDAKIRIETRGFIKRLQKELGITSVYVTHDQAEALVIADRIAILNRGILQQVGTPQEIYENPSNLFVATFIGAPPMNVIKGVIEEFKQGLFFVIDNSIRIPLDSVPYDLVRRYIGKDVILGVRPENVRVSKKGGIAGKVYVSEYLGNTVYVKIQISDNLIIQGVGESAYSIGDVAAIDIDMNKIHLFDEKTGSLII
ncbi:MAG: ABC transporter ATP-binding protein [Ignisphaera sp.]